MPGMPLKKKLLPAASGSGLGWVSSVSPAFSDTTASSDTTTFFSTFATFLPSAFPSRCFSRASSVSAFSSKTARSRALLWANEQSPLRGARGQGERARTDAAGGSASYSLTYELLYLGAVQGAAPRMLR